MIAHKKRTNCKLGWFGWIIEKLRQRSYTDENLAEPNLSQFEIDGSAARPEDVRWARRRAGDYENPWAKMVLQIAEQDRITHADRSCGKKNQISSEKSPSFRTREFSGGDAHQTDLLARIAQARERGSLPS